MNKQQEIVDALTYILQSAENIMYVTPDQTHAFKPTDLPAVLVVDESVQDELITIGSRIKRCTMLVRLILIVQGGTVASVIRDLVASLYEAIEQDPFLGNLAVQIIPVSREFELAQNGKMIAAANISLEITYDTTIWSI